MDRGARGSVILNRQWFWIDLESTSTKQRTKKSILAIFLPASSLETLSFVVGCSWIILNRFVSIKEGNGTESAPTLFELFRDPNNPRNVLLFQSILVVCRLINSVISYFSSAVWWTKTVGCANAISGDEYDRADCSWGGALSPQ